MDAPAASDVLGALYERHFEYVFRSLIRLGTDPTTAQDCAQEVFLILASRLDDLDLERPLRPWLFGVSRNIARRLLQTRRRNDDALEALGESQGPRPGLDSKLAATDLVRRALQLVEPMIRREVLILHALDDVPMKDVATVLEIPLNTAYSHYRRASEDFRAAVTTLGGHDGA